jgi:hypothetical protein
MDSCNFPFEPWTASYYFECARFFVEPDFASWLPFEVFDGIGNVDIRPVDSSRLKALIKKLARGSYKWLPLLILMIARLLANEKDRGR